MKCNFGALGEGGYDMEAHDIGTWFQAGKGVTSDLSLVGYRRLLCVENLGRT